MGAGNPVERGRYYITGAAARCVRCEFERSQVIRSRELLLLQAGGSLKSIYISYFGALKHLSHSQVLPYLKELAGNGVDVTLLSFEEPSGDPARDRQARDRLAQSLKEAGIDWRWLTYHKRPSLPATVYDIFLGIAYAAFLIQRKRIDVVHARNHVPGAMALVLQRLMGVRFLFDLRGVQAEEYVASGIWHMNSVPYRLTKWVESLIFARADAFVMLTERIRDALREQSPELRANRAPIEVIPCCVDMSRHGTVDREGAKQRLGLRGKVVMVYAGVLGGQYLKDELVRLFKAGLPLIEGLHFLVLTQSDHALMIDAFKEASISADRYTIATVGSEQMPLHLAAGDFGVHFLRPGFAAFGNSPTKFAEYLAAGLPILTNRGIGDSDTILAQDRVGVLVDAFEPPAYQRGLREICALLSEGEQLRARCREVARARFALNEVGRQGYLRVYRNLRPSARPAVRAGEQGGA
jgi:glycosyltransferase involved in cell wall biosynthesis